MHIRTITLLILVIVVHVNQPIICFVSMQTYECVAGVCCAAVSSSHRNILHVNKLKFVGSLLVSYYHSGKVFKVMWYNMNM